MTNQEIFPTAPINSDNGKQLEPTDFRLASFTAMGETTPLKCKKCEGMTEHAYYYLAIASVSGLSGRKAIYVCINDGTTTVANVKEQDK